MYLRWRVRKVAFDRSRKKHTTKHTLRRTWTTCYRRQKKFSQTYTHTERKHKQNVNGNNGEKSQFTVDSTVITWSTTHTRHKYSLSLNKLQLLQISISCSDMFDQHADCYLFVLRRVFFLILVRVPLSRMAIKFVVVLNLSYAKFRIKHF